LLHERSCKGRKAFECAFDFRLLPTWWY